jgi:hypothetical protein
MTDIVDVIDCARTPQVFLNSRMSLKLSEGHFQEETPSLINCVTKAIYP